VDRNVETEHAAYGGGEGAGGVDDVSGSHDPARRVDLEASTVADDPSHGGAARHSGAGGLG